MKYDMCQDVKGKKLLILAGAPQHCKLVRAAKDMGVYTVVTDYLPDSPAKKYSDQAYQIDIKNVDRIVRLCEEEHIDGIISSHIDPCQRPYYQICQQLRLPCYGTSEQFQKMTDKRMFKEMCKKNGVDIVPEYTENDVKSETIAYPVFVKPVDSRGSRGQSVCYQRAELPRAIDLARSESSNDDVLIEKCMRGAHEIQVTYFFVDGEPHLIRTADSYCGSSANHLENVVAYSVSPSRYTESYLATAHKSVVNMLRGLGVKYGPAFMQAFEDSGRFYFFDPGLRFPGVDYELIYQKVYGIDLMKAMVQIALTGKCCGLRLPPDSFQLAGKRAIALFPALKAGKIHAISGRKQVTEDAHVVSFQQRYDIGDNVEWTYTVSQRFAEIQILGSGQTDLMDVICRIQNELQVQDIFGQNMLINAFDALTLNGA